MKYVLLLLLLVTPSAAFGFAPAQQEPRIVKLNKELPVGADVALFRVASDADRVAYITDGMFDRICVTSMAGHEEPLDLAPVHEGEVAAFELTPNGEYVGYSVNLPAKYCVTQIPGGPCLEYEFGFETWIFAVPGQGGSPQLLSHGEWYPTFSQEPVQHFKFAPAGSDSNAVLYTRGHELYLRDLDGGAAIKLSTSVKDYTFTADGRYVIFVDYFGADNLPLFPSDQSGPAIDLAQGHRVECVRTGVNDVIVFLGRLSFSPTMPNDLYGTTITGGPPVRLSSPFGGAVSSDFELTPNGNDRRERALLRAGRRLGTCGALE